MRLTNAATLAVCSRLIVISAIWTESLSALPGRTSGQFAHCASGFRKTMWSGRPPRGPHAAEHLPPRHFLAGGNFDIREVEIHADEAVSMINKNGVAPVPAECKVFIPGPLRSDSSRDQDETDRSFRSPHTQPQSIASSLQQPTPRNRVLEL